MSNHRSLISMTPVHYTDGRFRSPRRCGLVALLAALVCIAVGGNSGAAEPEGKEGLVITSIPLFLLIGADPNVILTIDNSQSMNRAWVPDDIWGNAGTSPKLDARDTAFLTNRQYYNPALTYPPPRHANGTYWDHANFGEAPLSPFTSQDATCKVPLGEHYAPLWREDRSNNAGDPCLDLGATAFGDIKDSYSADVEHDSFLSFKDDSPYKYNKLNLGKDWALRCMGSKSKGDCPAFYYRLKQSDKTCAVHVDPTKPTKPEDFPIKCLERVIVGDPAKDVPNTENSATSIYGEVEIDGKKRIADITETVIKNRRDSLKNGDGTVPSDTVLAKRNFANWFSYYRTRFLTLQTVLSRVFADQPESMRFTYQNLPRANVKTNQLAAKLAPFEDKKPPEPQYKTDFFTWLGANRADNPDTLLITAAAMVDDFCRNADTTIWLEDPTKPEDTTTNPRRGCRMNSHIIFTDGAWTDEPFVSGKYWAVSVPWLANNDGDSSPTFPASTYIADNDLDKTYVPFTKDTTMVFSDHNTAMLADLVFGSWVTDLLQSGPGADNLVPPPKNSDLSGTPRQNFWNPTNDLADWQHIRTFIIGLGMAGEVTYPPGSWISVDSKGNESSGTLKDDGFPGDWVASGTTPYDLSQPNTTNSKWISQNRPEVKIDDALHAGLNGRGGYYGASDSQSLLMAFEKVLSDASSSSGASSAASVAIDSGSTAADDLIYQARLSRDSSKGWSGDVRSFRVSTGLAGACPEKQVGALCEDPTVTGPTGYFQSAAEATDALDWRLERHIATAGGDGAIAFSPASTSWDNLSPTQQLDFLRLGLPEKPGGYSGTVSDPAAKGGPTDEQVKEAKARLDYVAGDRTYESENPTYRFRTRATVLGDFINAGPVLVGPPTARYGAASYLEFMQAQKDRPKLIYAGANDGMLHAFDAQSRAPLGLKESFAFIPPALMEREKLHLLSAPTYDHESFVDGPIATGDALLSERGWRTVLAAGLGLGAQAVYALDITNPAKAASGDFKDLYLWQFTDRDSDAATDVVDGDPDLGYVLGLPSIARVRASFFGGKSDAPPVWVLITGNGYNSAEADGSRAAGCDNQDLDTGDTRCGQAVLYVIDLETGELKKRIPTGVGRKDDPLHNDADARNRRPNALGQPTVITTSLDLADGDILADFAYAADLFGNLYRFDLTGTRTPVRLLFSATAPDGTAQPITAPIAFAPHPKGKGALVLFGTGKYLEDKDQSDLRIQSFYGIWDKDDDTQTAVPRDKLLRQWFRKEIVIDGNEVRGRTSTDEVIKWEDNDGWYIDLKLENGENEGERVVTEPKVFRGRVLFSSLVPETDPCIAADYGWLNMLEVSNGGRPLRDAGSFDYTLDRDFSKEDLLPLNGGAEDEKVAGTSYRLTPGGKGNGVYAAPTLAPGVPRTGAAGTCGGGASDTAYVSTSKGAVMAVPLGTKSVGSGRVWQQLR